MPIVKTVNAKCDTCTREISTQNMDIFSGGIYEITVVNNVKRVRNEIIMCNDCFRKVFLKAIKDATIARTEEINQADEETESQEKQPGSESS